MSGSIFQCWCVCGKRNVVPGETQEFACECGRVSEVDWTAEIEGRQPGEQRKAVQ